MNRSKIFSAGLGVFLACGVTAHFANAQQAAQHEGMKMPMPAPVNDGKTIVSDPTSVVMIVNRDSNEISFMDIKSKKLVGRTFLGNNVNPHMVMMSPDGRYVVTGGTRANKAYIIDARTLELVKVIPVDIAPEHLSFSPDSRWYYQGNPEGDSISVIDMTTLTKVKTIPGFKEPLNVTFTPDGTKAYVGNYGAHWVGVVDVTRHELLKKIQVAPVQSRAGLDPERYLTEIQGINIATPSIDGRTLYAADSDLGVVGVIDTREDKVTKVIRVGKDPWRVYMGHDGKYAITPNNGDETISIIDLHKGEVAATLEAGPGMTGVNFAAGKAFVISSTSGFVYVYDMATLRPAGLPWRATWSSSPAAAVLRTCHTPCRSGLPSDVRGIAADGCCVRAHEGTTTSARLSTRRIDE